MMHIPADCGNAHAGHEIRTSIHTLVAVGGLLARTQLDAEQREYVNMIVDSSETLLARLNDILDFSKIEEGTPLQDRRSEETTGQVLPLALERPGATVAHSIAQSPEEPVVDVQRLWACADENREEMHRLLSNYLLEMESQLEQIEKSISEGVCKEMVKYAHRSCGASATFGFRAIAISLKAIERLGLKNTVNGASIQLAEARRQLELIREFQKSHLDTATNIP